MASKKKSLVHKQCRIFQWIEMQDESFAGAIRDLCLEGALSPKAYSTGVTFLYPKEDAYRKEVIEKAYSESPEEAEKMIKAMIIPDIFHTGADFGQRAPGSSLGIKYTVKGVEKSKISLDDGIELAPSDFRPTASREGTLAVWLIAKGRLPLQGEPYKAPSVSRRAPKTGGAGRTSGAGPRQELAMRVEREYDVCMQKDRCQTYNPYLAKAVSLLNFLKARYPELLPGLLPVLDYEPVITFYLLIEPYKTVGEYLIADSVLFGDHAWNDTTLYSNAVAEYEAVFQSIPEQQEASATEDGRQVVPLVFRDPAAVVAQIDTIRQRLDGSDSMRKAPAEVQSVYETLMTRNSIQGMSPILPDATIRALAAHKKRWQDEFRFILHEALQSMRKMPYSPDVFAGIVRDLRTTWRGNDYLNETKLSNADIVKKNVAPRCELMLLMKFVHSTDFLYLPAAPSAIGNKQGSATDMTKELYNRNAIAHENLRQIQGMVNATGLSSQAFQELQVYVQIYGRLPPEVSALVAGK